MQTLGMERGEAIEHKWVTRSIENAQKKVEGRNFDIRKSLLEYDDVANDQRRVVYEQRNDILAAEEIADSITAIREDVLDEFMAGFIPPQSMAEQWDVPGLEKAIETDFRAHMPVAQWLDEDKSLHEESLHKKILGQLVDSYNLKEKKVEDPTVMRQLEKQVMLVTLDRLWKEHLAHMDYLRQGIHLRGYAQKNPKQEYKREAFEMFQNFLQETKFEVIRILSGVELRSQDEVEELERQRRETAEREMKLQHESGGGLPEPDRSGDASDEPFQRTQPKVGRNEPCPCGSEKKFKHCHGKID